MCIEKKRSAFCGSYNLPVFGFLLAFIFIWIFAGVNAAQGDDENIFSETEEIGEIEESKAAEKPEEAEELKIAEEVIAAGEPEEITEPKVAEEPTESYQWEDSQFNHLDLRGGDAIRRSEILYGYSAEPPRDPISLFLGKVESIPTATRYFYCGLSCIALIAVILIIGNFQRGRLSRDLKYLRRNLKELTINDNHQRRAYALEQIRQDIREVNQNCMDARLDAKSIKKICREWTDINLNSTIVDLQTAKQTVESLTDSMNDTASYFQQTLTKIGNQTVERLTGSMNDIASQYQQALANRENEFNEAAERQAAKMSQLELMLWNTVNIAQKARAEIMQVTCMGVTED